MGIAYFAFGTNAGPTQIAGYTAFLVCTSEATGWLWMLVKELHNFLELAGNDLSTVDYQRISFRYHV